MTVYDKEGRGYKVAHSVDEKEWLEAGYTKEKPKKQPIKRKAQTATKDK